MHAEDLRIVVHRELVHVVDVGRERSFARRVIDTAGRELVTFFQDLRSVEPGQNRHEATTVPVIRNASSVVDLARHVRERIPRNVWLLFQEHLEVKDGGLQVRVVKLVQDVPTQRAKLAALLDIRVEEAHSQSELLPGLDLRQALLAAPGHKLAMAIFEVRPRRHVAERPGQVRTDTLRGFVRELDTVLENGDREVLRRHRGQPQAEALMDRRHLVALQVHPVAQTINNLLQLWHPRPRQVTVLKEHPIACLARLVHHLHGSRALALPK
mmetsp:Transcript_116989/g.283707  ORF Transcript_116989/g.283707 Transcript_116989/m.283707 type:complete len:269 (+) Transcript_116989:915-1721(+)